MGRIQSNIGLISGIPISETVNQLLKIEARPRDLLVSRLKTLETQQVAVTELTALVLGVQFAGEKLGQASVFSAKTATSSNKAALAAAVTGAPAAGTYQFTPVRQAQAHQLLSGGVASLADAVGEGKLTLRHGGQVDRPRALDELNGGQGVQRGKIRVTDRAGDSAVIDLRFAHTVDDVLAAINGNDDINIRAEALGDSFRLIDESGGAGNLRVAEVNGGLTAAHLGLANVDVAADEATGGDLVKLHAGLSLSRLNDGNGVSLRDALPDLKVTFRDGSAALNIDFHQVGDGGEDDSPPETTLGDLLATINAADPARLKAEISANGDRLVFTDLTSGAGAFSISSPLKGQAAEDLGLTGAASGGTITSRRLLGGLKSALLSGLEGGSGLGALGVLSLTDRAGATANVDLSSAETLDEVIDAINDAGVGVRAAHNAARNGLRLEDTSGASAGNFIVASGDASDTAAKLQITHDAAATHVDSGSLRLQVVSEQTRLADLYGGRGVFKGSFTITNSQGQSAAVNLKLLGVDTVGDVMKQINNLSLNVEARLNEAGDGILLIDKAGGARTLKVAEVGSGKSAADLGLLGDGVEEEIDGQNRQVVRGSTAFTIDLAADDTLEDVAAKINALGAGVTAGVFHGGAGATPFRLSLVSQTSGKAGELLVDASAFALGFEQIAAAQDALVAFGAPGGGASAALAASSTNDFSNLVSGLKLSVGGASTDPVTVTVQSTDADVVKQTQLLVDQYNKLREKIQSLTAFNEVDNTTGALFGSLETLRVETELANLFTQRFFGAGSIQSLGELGIGFKDDGSIEFNADKLRAKFAEDPAAVERFFTSENTGFSAKLSARTESLAGRDNSLLVNRARALGDRVTQGDERVTFFNQRLERRRDSLLKDFYNLELALAKLQTNLSALSQIQVLQPLSVQRG